MALSAEGVSTLGYRSGTVNGGVLGGVLGVGLLPTRWFYSLCQSLSDTDLDLLLSLTGGSTDSTFVEFQQLVFNSYVHIKLVPKLRVAGEVVKLRLELEHISVNLQASPFVFCTHTVTLEQLPALLCVASRLQASVDRCANSPANVRQALCITKVLTEDCIMAGRMVCSSWEAAYRALDSALQEDAVREAKRLMDRAYSGKITHIELVEEIATQFRILLLQPGAEVHGGPLDLYYCTFIVLMELLSPEWRTEVMDGLVLRGMDALFEPEVAVEEDSEMPFSDEDIDAQLALAMKMGITAYHARSALG